MTPTPALAMLVAVLCVVAITVLTALHDPVPSVLPELAIAAIAGHFALQTPGGKPPGV